jgi:hypothetical protein
MKRFVTAMAALIAGALTLTGHAQDASSRRPVLRYERAVETVSVGANRLAIDQWTVTVGQPFSVAATGSDDPDRPRSFVATGGLGDLRLFDAVANREVPYLLVPSVLPPLKWMRGEMLPLVATKTSSGFEVALAQVTKVDRIRIEGLPPRFLKRATLEGSGDREHWTALAPEATVFDLPDDRLKQLVIAFPSNDLRYLRLTWDDRSSARMPLPGAVMVREGVGQPPPEPLRIPLDVEKRPIEPGRSRYRLQLPAAHLPVTDLEVIAGDRHILRLARVTEPRLAGNQLAPHEIGTTTLRRASREEDDATAADLRVPIVPPETTRVELMIEDGNNPPLELTSVTAVLAPLPWIYFESPDGHPLVARLGDRKAVAPTYDLEAMRPKLATIVTAKAGWGREPAESEKQTIAGAGAGAGAGTAAEGGAGAAAGGGTLAGASLDVSQFHFSRDVPTSPAGLTTLALDAAVLAHSRLEDLRLVDRDSHQHAYILESRDEPLTIAVGDKLVPGQAPEWLRDELKDAPSGNRTIYRLPLPYDTFPASKLVLTTATRVFTRQVAIFVKYEPQPGRDRPGARRIASATWTHVDPEEPPPLVTFELPELQAAAGLVLMVDEGDNAPLPIESARVLLPGYQIRFLRTDPQPLTLFYGDPTLSAPRYDLALLKPYLLDAPAGEIVPGPEQERMPATSAAHLPFWGFWAILIGAVLVLLALIVRLLRSESASVGDPSP